MVKAKSYTPTNKRFKRHFQDIARQKARKGHLNQDEREQEDIVTEKGVLIRINKAKYNEDGWEVEVGIGDNKKTYNCVNGTGELTRPECIESEQYYTPKYNTSVDVLIDNVSKIYTITRIRSLKKVISGDSNKITIGGEGDDEEQKSLAQIILEQKNITITEDLKVDGDIESDNIEDLENEVKSLEERIKQLESIAKPWISED